MPDATVSTEQQALAELAAAIVGASLCSSASRPALAKGVTSISRCSLRVMSA